MSTGEIGSPESQKEGRTFYLSRGFSTGSDFIYDETYKNYRTKQRFQKDPKYSYFNAVMKMKRKLSSKQQIYNSVFTAKDPQTHQLSHESPQFYKTTVNDTNRLTLFQQPLDHEIIKIQQFKKNSFRIVKQQMPFESGLRKQNSDIVTTTSVSGSKRVAETSLAQGNNMSLRLGHKSNMSLYDKPSTYSSGNGPFTTSFEITTKSRGNNRSYLQLQIKQQQPFLNNNKPQSYQPCNPKPRLDEILAQYRKMNKHTVNNSNIKSRRSSLPRQLVEKLYQTNRTFYRSNMNNNNKRVSMG